MKCQARRMGLEMFNDVVVNLSNIMMLKSEDLSIREERTMTVLEFLDKNIAILCGAGVAIMGMACFTALAIVRLHLVRKGRADS